MYQLDKTHNKYNSAYLSGLREVVVYAPVDGIAEVLTLGADEEGQESLLKHGRRTGEEKRQCVGVIGQLERFCDTIVVPSYLYA